MNPASTTRPLWSPFGLHYGWVIVASAIIVNLAGSPLGPVAFSLFVVPMSEDLGWSRSELSWALTIRLVVAGLFGPLLGSLIDRFGSRWLGAAAGLLSGLSLIGISRVEGLWAFYLVYAVSGLAGFGVPAGALLTTVPIGKWFLHRRRGRAMALATAGIPIGGVLTIATTQILIASFGWRSAWLVLGLVLLAVVAPVSVWFMRRAPEDHGMTPLGAAAPTEEPNGIAAPEVSWTRGEALRERTTWAILIAQVLMGFAITGTLLYRVAYWHDLGMPSGLVAFGTALDPLTVIFSALVFGLIAERLPIRHVGFVAGLGWALSIVPMIVSTGEPVTLFLHNVIWGFFAGAFIAVNNLVWVTYYGRRALGAIQGIVLPATVAANAIAAPVYGALLDSELPVRLVWTFSLLLFAVSGVLLLRTHPPRRPVLLTGAMGV